MTVHGGYSDDQWNKILSVIQSAGAVLDDGDACALRVMMESAAHFYSWERPGTDRKRSARTLARLATMRERIQQLQGVRLGTVRAVKLAADLEKDLKWLSEIDAAFMSSIRFQARDFRGWLFLLDRELEELEEDFPLWADHRKDNPAPSGLHEWIKTLCELWERSGLEVRSSGCFPKFVEAAKTKGIRSGLITETTVRDFVLREWRCRTLES